MAHPVRTSVSVRGVAILLLLAVVGGVVPAPVQAQERSDLRQRVVRDVYGPDGGEKDGPMAHVHTALVRLHHQYERHRRTKGGAPFRADVPTARVAGTQVLVEAVTTRPGALLADLRRLGLEDGARAGHLVSGRLPISALEDAASIPTLRSLRPALWSTGIGRTTTRGDSAMQADVARMNQDVNGSDVKTCVLSDSYDRNDADSLDAVDDVGTGDLPGSANPNGFTTPVDVVEEADSNAFSLSDEGRAMLQFVHDVAPGAELGFHTATGGQANFADGIRTLAGDAGCDVVVDDIFYLAEPMFQDGVIAQAVTDVVEQGVAYFSAAGNSADRSYDTAEDDTPDQGFIDSGREGSDEPATDLNGDLHDFDDSDAGTDVYQQITVPNGSTLSISLQWDDPFLGACEGTCFADTDLDLFVLNAAADSVLTSAETVNVPSEPVEVIQFPNFTGQERTLNLAITRAQGPLPGRVKYIIFDDRISIDEHDTKSATAFGHINASGAAAVGATAWFDTPPFGGEATLEGFSSKGGIPILFDTQGDRLSSPEQRRTPDVTAPDGGNTTFFGQPISDGDDFPNFFGTSAAAPHAAGVATLMLSVDPSRSPAQVYQSLEASAIDITERFSTDRSQQFALGSGFDRFSGAGLIQAADAAPLPVELARFSGTASGDAVVLSWQTASETNNTGFRIEHSPPSADGWTVRPGFVEGAGTTTKPQTYRQHIDGLSPGTHRFRLRQVDTDGTVHTSDPVAVRVDLAGAFQLTGVHPNPVRQTGEVRLTVDASQEVRAELFNVLGQRIRVVYDGRIAADEPTTWTLDGTDLASGVYFLRVKGATFSATRKFVRIR